jgi:predicted DsbA family dithiol-disulfide isomerase
VNVRYRAFPLHPETPEEGQSLQSLFGADSERMEGMLAHLRRTADELGLPFAARTMTYNSRLAQELGQWAAGHGREGQFHNAAFHAYFAEGSNVAKKEVLLDICRASGLPVDEAAEVLASRSFAAAVDADWQLARRLGVTAVPTFIVGDQRLVGAQPYEALEWLVRQPRG